MLAQIVIGSLLISVTVVIEAAFIGMAIAVLNRHGPNLLKGHRIIKMTLFITGITLWMVAALAIAVWLWALTFIVLDLFALPEDALYFAAVSFTTLGFGDVLLEKPWRLLSGFSAANGLILFSLSTAFLFEAFGRLQVKQD